MGSHKPNNVKSATQNGWGIYALLAAALALSLLARFYERFPGDLSLVRWIQAWHHPTTTALMEALSVIGKSLYLFAMASVMLAALYATKRRRESLATGAILVILGLTPLLQLLINRSRPPAELVGRNDPLGGLGFPSGHAFQSLVLFGFFIYLADILVDRTWLRLSIQTFLALLILGIGLSRVYLGAHWPSDILGAYLLGSSFLALLFRRFPIPTSQTSQ